MPALIVAAAGAYLAAFAVSARRPVLAYTLAGLGLAPHALAIAQRWQEQGHGPYLGLYDSLSSNLWLQLALFLLIAALSPTVRRARTAALALGALFAAWLVVVPATTSPLPPTFDTPWFYAHVLAGKLGYALLSIAAAVAVTDWRVRQPGAAGYRLMLVAFACHSAMLLSGAAWGYAAWGGYWDWNVLETWTLLTWFGFGLYFHARAPGAPPAPRRWLAVGVYVLAVLTFYGVPFLSRASHQGLT
jgi:ABC-type transport system involved in cytochrome c biogenesis permease subunit